MVEQLCVRTLRNAELSTNDIARRENNSVLLVLVLRRPILYTVRLTGVVFLK